VGRRGEVLQQADVDVIVDGRRIVVGDGTITGRGRRCSSGCRAHQWVQADYVGLRRA